jgi:hypothetical protein
LGLRDIYYVVDTPPVLGPGYLAAARVTSLQLSEPYIHETLQQLQKASVPVQQLNLVSQFDEDMVFQTLQQLQLSHPVQQSIDSWCCLFSNCPILIDVVFWSEDTDIFASMTAAAEQLGITIVKQDCTRHAHYRLLRP